MVMPDEILHICGYHCDRPECVRRQRDELRDRNLTRFPCIWEDCDQQAIYCYNHALELANVGSEREAEKLRARIHDLEVLVERLRGGGK